MLTTVEALQDLYVSLGGVIDDVQNFTTIPDMISAISDFEEGKTEEERTVTSEEIDAIIGSIE